MKCHSSTAPRQPGTLNLPAFPWNQPSAPPYLRSARSQQPPASSSEETCPICLTAVRPEATGQSSRFVWPHCQHTLQTGCAAHLIVERLRPPCPTCRHRWDDASDLSAHAQCQHHSVALPAPLATIDTRPPHTSRLQKTQPPPAPAHTLPLCCHRLLLVDPSRPEDDAAWRELPGRHMQGAPAYCRSTGAWHREWTCLWCSANITPENELLRNVPSAPSCPQHGPRTLAIDLRRRERRWVCGHPSGHFHQCQPEQLPPHTAQPRHSRVSRWRFFAATGVAILGPTICISFPAGLSSMAICLVHPGWHRECPPSADSHGRTQPRRGHCFCRWHRGLRSHLTGQRAHSLDAGPRSQPLLAIRHHHHHNHHHH